MPTVLCQLCGVTAALTNRANKFYVQCVTSLLSQLIERTMFVSNCATITIYVRTYVVAFNVAFVAVAVVTRRTLLFQCSCVFCSFFLDSAGAGAIFVHPCFLSVHVRFL